MIRRYEDFEVVITKQGDQLYANLGTAPGDHHLPGPIPITLPNDRVAWTEAFQGHKGEAELAELGHRLFDAIIRDELLDNWHACLGEVRGLRDTGLRLRFSYQADALTQVPLELLCSRIYPTRDFVALNPATPVVRSPLHGGLPSQRDITLPLRMLVVMAGPELQVPVDFAAMRADLQEILANLIESRKLIIEYLGLPDGPGADYGTLHHAVVQTEYPPDIVHFIGHGISPDAGDVESQGVLLFTDQATGRREDVSAADLGNILAHHKVRMVVLQACDSAREGTHNAFQGVAQQLIARGLPAVLAMQCPVQAHVATAFCSGFYNFWLAKEGLPIELALTEARQAVHQQFGDRPLACWAPVLFIRQRSTEVLKVRMRTPPSDVHLKRGWVMLEGGRPDEAIPDLEQAYQRIPSKARISLVRALVDQAQMELTKGNHDTALASCERVLQISPNDHTAQEIRTSVWIRRGDQALEGDDLDRALEAYEQVKAKDKIAEVERRRQRKQDALEEEAARFEKEMQWDRAVRVYQVLLGEARDEGLQNKWKNALKRVEESKRNAREKEAAEHEEKQEWTSAAAIYQVLISETQDGKLQDKWKARLGHARDQIRAPSLGPEPEIWKPDHILDNKYRILEHLATTNRCEVYQGQERHLHNALVVIKRLKPDKMADNDARERFKREIEVLRSIRHPSVLSCYDANTVGDNYYFVAEFADKGSLNDYLASRPDRKLGPLEALEIMVPVCEALDAAHRKGVIHRDLKPANIFLFSSGGSVVAKLADFSIARVPDTHLTQVDEFLGSPYYASPEQQYLQPDIVVDARSDLYSWALVLFEMLTGRSPKELLMDEYPHLPLLDEFPSSFLQEKGVPPEFVTVLQKALRPYRERRYQSARELLKDLQAARSQIMNKIAQCLSAGEERLRSLMAEGEERAEVSEWQEVRAEFERGLELGKRGDMPELPGEFGKLACRLRAGSLCAQGMMSLSDRQWQAALEAFEALQRLTPTYLTVDVTAKLEQARLEQQRERDYQDILRWAEQGSWTLILRAVPKFDGDYQVPGRESVSDIRKRALFAQGKALMAVDLERAYYPLHELYEADPGYKDVAGLCTKVAYENGVREGISQEQKVGWLEKVTVIDPHHREGRTQQELDEARFGWANELLGEQNIRAALCQLERLSPSYYQNVAGLYASVAFEYGTREGVSQEQKVEWLEKVTVIDPHHREGRTQQELDEARHRWAEELLGEHNSRAALCQLERISPAYRQNVAGLHASVAFENGTREGTSLEQKVEWLEKVTGIDPHHREGRTQQELDEARHRWAEELLGEHNSRAALCQLERISPAYGAHSSVYRTLVQLYYELLREGGHVEHGPRDLSGEMRWRNLRARARAWVRYHKWETVGGGIAFIFILVVLGVVGAVQPRQWAFVFGRATATLSPPSLTVPPVVTPTVMPASPTHAPTIAPSETPTSPTPSPSRSPSPSPTPTAPLPSSTPTLTISLPPPALPTLPSLTLLAPAPGREYRSPIVFEWQGSLGVGQVYQLSARHDGTDYGVQSGGLKDTYWKVDLPADQYGKWHWTVSVIEGGRILTTSEEWHFYFNPRASGNGADGGSGTPGGDTPTPADPTPTPA